MPSTMAAEVPAAMATTMEMTSASVTTTMTPAMTATATFRGCIAAGRQRSHENNDGDTYVEFCHGALRCRMQRGLRHHGFGSRNIR
jgi:microcystin-dependent protein